MPWPVLVSHRRHAPFDGLCVELDRVLAPSWVARRVQLVGVVQDEHLTTGLGKGMVAERARLKVLLRGRMHVTVRGRAFELVAGDFLLLPRIAECLACGDGDEEVLELDWDATAPLAARAVTTLEHGVLGARALEAAGAMARTLHQGALFRIFADGLRALASDGLPLDAGGAQHEMGTHGAASEDVRLLEAIDDTLTNLDDGPAVVALEEKLGWSRRTVSRRTTDLHQRYGVSGIEGESWRTVRDLYRLILGTILATHANMTTRALAAVLGYASPDALCHAFANAGLRSPGSIKKVGAP